MKTTKPASKSKPVPVKKTVLPYYEPPKPKSKSESEREEWDNFTKQLEANGVKIQREEARNRPCTATLAEFIAAQGLAKSPKSQQKK